MKQPPTAATALLLGTLGLGLPGTALPDEPVNFSVGRRLLGQYHCQSCHRPYEAGPTGPSLVAIARKYASDPLAREHVADSVLNGSAGAWGDDSAMAGYAVPPADLHVLVDWILSLKD